MSSTLHAIGLRKSYAGREVVADVDIAVSRGEVVGLLGPSGSGKSTTFNLFAGLLRPESGSVLLDDRDITDAPVDARARLGIGYVPQSPQLFGKLSAEDNLRIAIEARDRPHSSGQVLDALCKAFELEPFRKTRLANLSGGQRRWVEIAFAICGNPAFLLLDEPFTGLDPIASIRLSEVIARLARFGIGILLTDHKVRNALQIVERAYVIDNGVIIAAGTSEAIVKDPDVRATYLGADFAL
jgi:lipopolysaccharide export system ATP-binding protein